MDLDQLWEAYPFRQIFLDLSVLEKENRWPDNQLPGWMKSAISLVPSSIGINSIVSFAWQHVAKRAMAELNRGAK